MRIIASFYKHDEVRFVSHLDMQRLFQRAFRRAGLPLSFSQGFNPHPLLSFATALSVGYTSDCEYFDVMLAESIPVEEFADRVNAVLPAGVHIIDVIDAGSFKTSLTSLMRSASYVVEMQFQEPKGVALSQKQILNGIDSLLDNDILVMKKTKGGIKQVNIRPMLIGIKLWSYSDGRAVLGIEGKLTAEGGLPLELLFEAFYEKLNAHANTKVNRARIEMDWGELK